MNCNRCQQERKPGDLLQEIYGSYLRKRKWRNLIVFTCKVPCAPVIPEEFKEVL